MTEDQPKNRGHKIPPLKAINWPKYFRRFRSYSSTFFLIQSHVTLPVAANAMTTRYQQGHPHPFGLVHYI